MKQPTNHYDVIVIGGGASGMICAGRAASRGKRVLLLEKNKTLGEKLKITGGGRCNITNAQPSERLFLSHFGAAEKFLYSAFSQFGVGDTFAFFESKGLPLVTEAFGRVFPKTQSAVDVCDVLERYLRQGNVEVMRNAKVTDVVGANDKIEKVIVNGKEFFADSYVVATGGKSHPETGSTGDGFVWLKNLGHNVKEPTPTIVPLAVNDKWVVSLAGKKLPESKVTFFLNNKKQFAVKGAVLCTHFGLSGPVILNSAGKVADLLHEGAVTATIDLYPEFDIGGLDKHIIKIFDEHKNKNFKTVFKFITPSGTSGALMLLIPDIDPETKVHSIGREQRKTLAHLLKALPVTVTGLMGYDRAVIADGGLAITELDSKTMRSKRCSNLFVTGDLLHISRPSGGYSLQLCWTTGFVAGSWV